MPDLRPSPRISLFAAVLAALVLAGCGGPEGGNYGGKPPNYAEALAGSPAPLAALHKQGNQLLPGGREAYEERIAALRGFPAVVNVWASWCGPCRFEFPALQDASAEYGKRVAFLGVNTQDSEAAAETFLRDNPVPYPSYVDGDEEIADSIAGRGLPATAFYDRSGELVYFTYVPYESGSELNADIRRYALGESGAEGG